MRNHEKDRPTRIMLSMLVREMMTGAVTVRPDDTLATARDCLRAHGALHLLVMDGSQVVGVLSMRDLAGKPADTPVGSIMKQEVTAIDAGASLRRAASLMIRATTGCLPVTENGVVAGIITTSDLMRVLEMDMTLS
jgi:CBS domain-containing protein